MKKTFIILCTFLFLIELNGQELVYQTFKDTKVINTPSTLNLKKGHLDFRVSHRFGDIAGNAGGWTTFYGLENAADIGIGLDYGLTDKFMIGISRTKGSSDLKQNVHGSIKLSIMQQKTVGSPFSLSFYGIASYSTMQGSPDEGVLTFFEKSAHRMSYHLQALLSKKLSDRFSFQVGAAWTYRNLVQSDDKNDLPSISGILKYQLNKSFGIIIDANLPFSDIRTTENDYYFPLGIGLEWETGGGHVFQMNFTNATGLAETDYLPYTRTSWADGEYRFGFTISRQFRIR